MNKCRSTSGCLSADYYSSGRPNCWIHIGRNQHNHPLTYNTDGNWFYLEKCDGTVQINVVSFHDDYDEELGTRNDCGM